jgi:3'(2'), 5'-bisphosphate nucleotidase
VWIIDPLDGTREFSEVPRIDWAVHVALVEDGQPTAGAVALPAVGVTHSTAQPPQILAEPNRPPRLAVSRSRPLLEAMALADELDADLMPMGSGWGPSRWRSPPAWSTATHTPAGQYEWGQLRSGCGRPGGRPVVFPARRFTACAYNRPDPWLPDLLICHPGVHDQVAATLADFGWSS